jgi:hypothetical protein
MWPSKWQELNYIKCRTKAAHPGQKLSKLKMKYWTTALPLNRQGEKMPSHEVDRVDNSPPMKFTGQTKGLPLNQQSGQQPSHEVDRVDNSPPMKFTDRAKAHPWNLHVGQKHKLGGF